MIFRSPYYYLFYSGNSYHDDRYAVGVARSQTLDGPWEKHGAPILATSTDYHASPWAGPGHCSVIGSGPDGTANMFMLYHAHPRKEDGTVVTHERWMLRDEVSWSDLGWPMVGSRGMVGAPTSLLYPDQSDHVASVTVEPLTSRMRAESLSTHERRNEGRPGVLTALLRRFGFILR